MTNWGHVLGGRTATRKAQWYLGVRRYHTVGSRVRPLHCYGTKVLYCAIINSCSAGIQDAAEIGRTINNRIYQTTNRTRNAPIRRKLV